MVQDFLSFLKGLKAPLKDSSLTALGIFQSLAKASQRLWDEALIQQKSSFPRWYSEDLKPAGSKEKPPSSGSPPAYKTSLSAVGLPSMAPPAYKTSLSAVGLPSMAPPAYKTSLFLWAEERGMRQLRGEKTEVFAKRVAQAFVFLAHAGTYKGMSTIISQVTDKNFCIRELYKERWILGSPAAALGEGTTLGIPASFHFIVEFSGLTLAEKEYLDALICLYKPAHVGFHINAPILDDWILGLESERLGESTYLEA